MFDRLLVSVGLNSPLNQPSTGFIWSLEGDHYLAFLKNAQGEVIKQANHAFRSLFEAKEWLHSIGVHEVIMEQSNAYFEMVGQEAHRDELRGHSEIRTH